MPAERRRFLIWGKTTPQLSMKYFETVCTGAVLEDGKPIRLYPIDFRYLDGEKKFKKYQWMTAEIWKNPKDARPESYRIDADTIELGDVVPSDPNEWRERARIMFRYQGWQFHSVDELAAAEASSKLSIGVVDPMELLGVRIVSRPEDELHDFERKRERVRQKWQEDRDGVFDVFIPPELKNIDFVKNRIEVEWVCGSGKKHRMQVFDWEVTELQRRVGDEKARRKVEEVLSSPDYATRLFLGNIQAHPKRFTIVGLWYPKRATDVTPPSLFDD